MSVTLYPSRTGVYTGPNLSNEAVAQAAALGLGVSSVLAPSDGVSDAHSAGTATDCDDFSVSIVGRPGV